MSPITCARRDRHIIVVRLMVVIEMYATGSMLMAMGLERAARELWKLNF